MKKIGILFLSLFVLASCSKDDDTEKEAEKGNAKKITAFTFLAADNQALSVDITATLDEDNKTITAEVPFGTNVTALKPTVVVSNEASVSPSNKTETDFSETVTYTVTAEDDSTQKYETTITIAKSSAKAITSFSFLAADNEVLSEDLIATLNEDEKTITAEVLFGTNVTALKPTIVWSNAASVAPANKTETDFSDTVTYTVTAEDDSTVEYKVSISFSDSNEKEITAFTFLATDNQGLPESIEATINVDDKTITAELPFGVDISALVPNIVVSENASVNPNDKTPTDFSETVTYIVTAEDSSEAEYKVTIALREITEREVLLDLYNNNPGNFLTWNLNSKITNWTGVTLENDKVVELELTQVNLTTIPPSIAYLKNIKKLTLWGNSISSIPVEIGDFENLEQMSLSNNRFTTFPVEIVNLSNLERLYINNNQITSIPAEIGNLTNLEQLGLGDNSLTSIPSEVWNLTKLERLTLSGNSFISIPVEIGNLANLGQLELSDNSLTSIPTEVWNLTKLERLTLSGNSFISIPAEIGNLANLGQLELSDNSLASVPTEIGSLTNLEVLDLQNNSLTSIPTEIGNLNNLVLFYLNNNQITSIPKEICDLDIVDFKKDDTAICEE